MNRASLGPRARHASLAALFVGLCGFAAAANAQPPPVSSDDFVAMAAGSDQYEIMAARVALIESRDPTIRAFATEMIRDHSASTSALQQAAARSRLKPPPSSVGGDQVQLLSALQGLRGADFDKAYERQQVLAHTQALTTMRGYLREGTDPNLKAVARSNLPMIEHHLQEAQSLAK